MPSDRQVRMRNTSNKSLLCGTYFKRDTKTYQSQSEIKCKLQHIGLVFENTLRMNGYESYCMSKYSSRGTERYSKIHHPNKSEDIIDASNSGCSIYKHEDLSGISVSSYISEKFCTSVSLSHSICADDYFRHPNDVSMTCCQNQKLKSKKGFIQRFRTWRPRKIFIGDDDEWSVSTIGNPDVYPKFLNITSGRF